VSLPLPPLDAHAHVAPGVPAGDLASLRAAVFAVTLSLSEWEQAAGRTDERTAWGLGCHPAISGELEAFSPSAFSEALDSAALVGEVGLDARRGASIAAQREVFSQVLEMLTERPRLVSVHSVGASRQVLDALERHPQSGAILHWWRGSITETDRALEMGCFFSLNAAEAIRPKIIGRIPPERVLTETDFPHTQRHDPAGDRPGVVETIERALGEVWALDEWGVRQQIWTNLAVLLDQTASSRLMPTGIRKALLLAPAGAVGRQSQG
jgi:TatD DNase family protein